MKSLRLIVYVCPVIAVLLGTAMPSPAQRPTKTPPKVLSPTAKTPTAKTFPLAFDNLNDFIAKGLPAPSALPAENLDIAAVIMARQISKSDEKSLPILITALETAGFTIIDENGKVLQKPLGDVKGQGLAFYDFEAVGALKLANRNLGTSLNNLAGIITKETPKFTASQFSALVLQELRAHADNTENPYLRFWARLIIELGRSSAKPVDLMTASPGSVNLTMLQASLLTRRLQGDLYAVHDRLKQTGKFQRLSHLKNSFVPAVWGKEDLPLFRPISLSVSDDPPCNLTNNEALILDAAAVGLTAWNGWQFEKLGHLMDGAEGYHTTLGKVGLGLQGANIALAWLKLVAAVTSLKGEITVDSPPLIRTINSTPGEKRLMKARIWSEVGRKEMLNCLRPLLNVATGLDFNLPTDGPVSNVAVEWHFAGDNETRVNDASTRNTEKFVVFESPAGQDANPQKQVTDDNGISRMYLVGSPKIPAVVYQKNPMKVEKEANILVGVTLKSAKDFTQNVIDIGGTALGLATGGPLGLVGSAAELGYRIPYVPARATIPVIDHEPCDGQWQGTVKYTVIRSISLHSTIPPAKNIMSTTDGGHDNSDETTTWSGTVTVNGGDDMAAVSFDTIYTHDRESHGTTRCCPDATPCNPGRSDMIAWSNQETNVAIKSGSGQNKTSVGISLDQGLDKDSYKISFQPFDVDVITQNSSQKFYKVCAGNHPRSLPPENFSNSGTGRAGHFDYITGKARFGQDRNNLSGSYTQTLITGEVTTISWDLRRCN